MCKIKTGANIQTKSDILNLITALLFRQVTDFTVESILTATEYYMENSPCIISTDDIKKMIIKDIDVMQRNQEIQCIAGRYSVTRVD